jgi:hypothetical protein
MLISVLLVMAGASQLTQATAGVGYVCIGIAFGVWCRINQAADYRRQDKKLGLLASPRTDAQPAGAE